MRRRKHTIGLAVLLSCLMLAPLYSFAQDQEVETSKPGFNYGFAVHPLYLFNNGLRVDIERKLHHPDHWLVVGLSGIYLGRDEDEYSTWSNLYLDSNQDVTKLSGGGIDIAYKYIVPTRRKSLYISGSLNYNYFKTQYYAVDFFPFEENGITYYERDYRELSQQINRIGSNLLVGLQSTPRMGFLIDGFMGLGWRYGIPRHKDRYDFDSHAYSLGYRGITFTIGMRIGFRTR